MADFYKCPNLGTCGKADRGEMIAISAGSPTRCPECESNLVAQTGNVGSSKKGLALGALLLLLLAGIIWATLSLLTPDGDKTASPVGSGSAPVGSVTPVPSGPSPPVPSPTPPETPTGPSFESQQMVNQGLVFLAIAKQGGKSRPENMRNAVVKFDQAIASEGQRNYCYAVAYMNRGVAQMLIGKPNKAAEDLGTAIKCDPKNPTIHYNFAAFYSLQNQLDLAIEQLDAALESGFNDCDALRTDSDLAKLRRLADFRTVLEKHKMFCLK